MPKVTHTGDINPHFEQTDQEIEKADQLADLHRKYGDIYKADYVTPEARKYRIRKLLEDKIEPWGNYSEQAVVNKDKYNQMKRSEILEELEDRFGGEI